MPKSSTRRVIGPHEVPIALNADTRVTPLLLQATQFLTAAQPADAIALLREAAALAPHDAMIQHDLGLACLEAGCRRRFAGGDRERFSLRRCVLPPGIALEKQGELRGEVVAYDHATEH